MLTIDQDKINGYTARVQAEQRDLVKDFAQLSFSPGSDAAAEIFDPQQQALLSQEIASNPQLAELAEAFIQQDEINIHREAANDSSFDNATFQRAA